MGLGWGFPWWGAQSYVLGERHPVALVAHALLVRLVYVGQHLGALRVVPAHDLPALATVVAPPDTQHKGNNNNDE